MVISRRGGFEKNGIRAESFGTRLPAQQDEETVTFWSDTRITRPPATRSEVPAFPPSRGTRPVAGDGFAGSAEDNRTSGALTTVVPSTPPNGSGRGPRAGAGRRRARPGPGSRAPHRQRGATTAETTKTAAGTPNAAGSHRTCTGNESGSGSPAARCSVSVIRRCASSVGKPQPFADPLPRGSRRTGQPALHPHAAPTASAAGSVTSSTSPPNCRVFGWAPGS